jgi:hypothetical protein
MVSSLDTLTFTASTVNASLLSSSVNTMPLVIDEFVQSTSNSIRASNDFDGDVDDSVELITGGRLKGSMQYMQKLRCIPKNCLPLLWLQEGCPRNVK